MFKQIYHEYLLHKNEQNRKERYEGKEGWYHASGAGLCSRKLYFESVEKAVPTNPPSERSLRVMRLGTILHDEFQNALIYNNNINNNINNNTNDSNIVEQLLPKGGFVIEGEIILEELNVRGFFDFILYTSSASDAEPLVQLYDLKSAASWSYRRKFGKKVLFPQDNRNYNLQLGTYGLGVQKKYGKVDEMGLLYYNKDTSEMKLQNVSLHFIDEAKRYWRTINEEHSKGLPGFVHGTSPGNDWICNKYCQFKDHCNPPAHYLK